MLGQSGPLQSVPMAKTLDTTPLADGFSMPAEFAPHAGCWMLWPERPDNWRLGALPAQQAFANVATAIARFEPVTVGVSAGTFRVRARAAPGAGARRRDVPRRCLDARRRPDVRDQRAWRAPRRRLALQRLGRAFRAGSIFRGTRTTSSRSKVLEIEGSDRYRAPIVNEGGAIHVDGEGTALVTEQVLLNPNRNPGMAEGRDRAPAHGLSRRADGHLAGRGRRR